MQGRIRGGDGTFAIAVGSSPTTALAIDTSTKATTLSGTLTVGANDTGYDVRLYGATSGRYWEWDASMDLVRMRDNVKAVWGNGDDLQLFHDGSNSYIQHGSTGALNITLNAGGEFAARFVRDAAVELYYNGTKTFETTSAGVTITGTATATTFSGSGASLTSLNATQLTSGTVPAARLGNVTIASSATDILSASSGSISADDAGADKIVFWDDSASKLTYLTVGSKVSIFDIASLRAPHRTGTRAI